MDPTDSLLAGMLERPDAEWKAALEALCRAHPDLAGELQRRFAQLERIGVTSPAPPDAEAPVPALPEQFGPYRLVRRLGGGGMGVVWLALHQDLGREVAIKMIRPERLWFDRPHERFRREVEAVARLRHQGCVQIHQVGETAGVPFFAMEYVPGANCEQILSALRAGHKGGTPARLTGGDLAAALRQRGVLVESDASDLFAAPWHRVAVRIVLAAAEALAHAHSRGVVHRDLKPSNLMVTPGGRVVVIDFGLAVAAGSSPLTREGSLLGSLPYMAPEQVRGERDAIGERTDVYGLGVCLYELLALVAPFASTDEARLRQTILHGDCPPLRDQNPAVGRDLAVVVARAMHVEASRRYPSVLAFAADLVAVLADRPILARRDALSDRLLRWARRHPAVATASGLLLLAVLTVPTAISVAIAGQRDRAVAAELVARRREYGAGIAAAASALRAGNAVETRLRLDACAEDLRGFEWRHLAIALDSSLRRIDIGAPVTAVAATADGRFAAAGTEDGRIALVGLADGPPRRDLLPAGGPKVLAVAFGTGGQELFAVDDDQTLRVFGVADGALRRQRPRTGAQERLWLPRDVDRIVCETSPSHVSVLDPVDLTPRTPVVLADSSWTGNGRMVVDGDDLVAGSRQGVLVWSLRDGSRKRSFPVGEIRARSAGPRGDLVAGDVDGAILVIDRTTGTERRYDIGRRRIGDAQFVRDGRYLIAPCDTGEVLVFDLTRGGLPRSLLGHLGRVEAAAAIGDGSTFVTGGADGAVRLSHAVLGNEQVELIGIGEGRGLGIDGRGRLLTGDDDAVLSAVDVDTGAVVYRAPHEHWVNAVAGLPAEDLTVSAFGSVLRFWAAGDGAPRGDLALPAGFGMVTHIAPGEGAWRHRCAVGSREGRIAVVDTAARTVLAAHPAHDGMVTGLAFDAERQRFLSAGVDGRLLAVDAAAPDAGAREVLRAATRFRALAVAADRLFTSEEVRADGGGVLAERDPTTAAVRRSTPVGDAVVAIASIDRQRLAVGTAHGHVAIWDVAMLAPVFEQPLFPRGVRNVVAGPAGDWVAAIGYGGAPRILWARAPAEGSTALGQERQRVADLRQVADEAMAWTAWRPAAERRIRADQRLRAADRELAAACLPPVNAWSIASACYDEFASRVGTRPHEGKWRERYLLLQEIVHGGVGGHAVFCRCALALGAVRCGEPRVAVAALDGLVLTANSPDRGDGWFRPGYHFALGMAHLQLGERAAARAERDALQRLLAGEFAADRRGWCFLDELERAIAAQ